MSDDDSTSKKPRLGLKAPAAGKPQRGDRAPVRGMSALKNKPRPTLAQAQAEREQREARMGERPPRREDRGSASDRPPRRDERGAFGDRPPHRDERAPFGDRPPRRDDRGQFGDRPPRRDDRAPFGERPPRRDERGAFGDRPPRRDDRAPFGDRPPRRDERGAFGDRPPRRDERAPYGDRPPRRDDRAPFGDRPPRRDGPGNFAGSSSRPPRSGEGDRPPRRDDRAPFGDRPPRRDDRGPLAGSPSRSPRRESQASSSEALSPRPPRPVPPERTNFSSEGERLSKRMAELGLASRREADEWILAGWVKVDGKVAELGLRVGPEVQIDIDPAARQQQAQRVTILLHKPIGYVSGQPEDGYEPAVALLGEASRWSEDPLQGKLRFTPAHLRGLAPAGRLDIDSTGLLVLTQDGRVAKALIGDDSDIEKEYLVRVALADAPDTPEPMHHLPAEKLALLNHGLELDGVMLREAKVSWANEDQLRFVLREGRKRQIRRMCEAVGLNVLALKRVRIGRIPLSHLPQGQWRYLAPWEKF